METVFQESGPRTSLALPSRTVLNDTYEIGRVLGKGGFGITYAALDTHLQIPVAIKEFLPAQVAGRGTDQSTVQPHGGNEAEVFEHGLSAFLAEAQTLAQFNHQNIVQVRAFFRQNGTGYFVMPFYEGRTMDEVMKAYGGPMPADKAMDMITPVLDGLEVVHAKSLLHRDIKPQNVYITDEGDTILLDFGAARVSFGQESQSLSAVLTPGYAPFEQYSRRGHQGPWTDVYATAAVLYRMLTGTKPPEATDRIAGEPLIPIHHTNPSVPPPMAGAVESALATQPKDRPQSIADFRSRLHGGTGEDVRTHLIDPDDFKTRLVEDEEEGGVHGGAWQPPRPETQAPPDLRKTIGTLVLRADQACRYRLNNGDIMRLERGETREVPVQPGEHELSVGFGRAKFRLPMRVHPGERRVVPLAPPARGVPKWAWLAGGAVAVVVIAAVAIGSLGTSGDVVSIDLAPPGVTTEWAGSLADGDATLAEGEYADVFTFGTAPGVGGITASLESGEFDTYLFLLDANDTVIDSNDDADGFNAEISTPLTGTPPYRLFATSASQSMTGDYILTITSN